MAGSQRIRLLVIACFLLESSEVVTKKQKTLCPLCVDHSAVTNLDWRVTKLRVTILWGVTTFLSEISRLLQTATQGVIPTTPMYEHGNNS